MNNFTKFNSYLNNKLKKIKLNKYINLVQYFLNDCNNTNNNKHYKFKSIINKENNYKLYLTISKNSKKYNNYHLLLEEVLNNCEYYPTINIPKTNKAFVLLQHKELLNNFKFIYGIQKLTDLQINKEYSEYNIIKREYSINSIQLYKLFKDAK